MQTNDWLGRNFPGSMRVSEHEHDSASRVEATVTKHVSSQPIRLAVSTHPTGSGNGRQKNKNRMNHQIHSSPTSVSRSRCLGLMADQNLTMKEASQYRMGQSPDRGIQYKPHSASRDIDVNEPERINSFKMLKRLALDSAEDVLEAGVNTDKVSLGLFKGESEHGGY